MYPVLLALGPITIYSFGIFAVLAFLVASFVIWKRGRECHFLEEDIFDGIVIVGLLGLVGARIAYILLQYERFGLSIISWFSIYRISGLTFYGGLILGWLGLWFISRKKRWDMFSASDVAVTGLSLGQAIGWIGALFSGFGYGREAQNFGLKFVGEDNPRLPLQFLWIVGFLALFIFLWKIEERYRTIEWYRGKRSSAQTGFLTFSYLIGFGFMQLAVALLSDPYVYLFGLPLIYLVILLVLVIGVSGIYLRSGRELGSDTTSIGRNLSGKMNRMLVFLRQSRRKISIKFKKRF